MVVDNSVAKGPNEEPNDAGLTCSLAPNIISQIDLLGMGQKAGKKPYSVVSTVHYGNRK